MVVGGGIEAAEGCRADDAVGLEAGLALERLDRGIDRIVEHFRIERHRRLRGGGDLSGVEGRGVRPSGACRNRRDRGAVGGGGSRRRGIADEVRRGSRLRLLGGGRRGRRRDVQPLAQDDDARILDAELEVAAAGNDRRQVVLGGAGVGKRRAQRLELGILRIVGAKHGRRVVGQRHPGERRHRIGDVRGVVEVLADVGRVEPAGVGVVDVVHHRLAQHHLGARLSFRRRRHGEADLDMRQVIDRRVEAVGVGRLDARDHRERPLGQLAISDPRRRVGLGTVERGERAAVLLLDEIALVRDVR